MSLTRNFGRVGDKSMFKMHKKAGVGREGDICIYDCNYLLYAFHKLFQIDECDEFFCGPLAKGNCYRQNTSSQYPLVVSHVTAAVKNWSSVEQ